MLEELFEIQIEMASAIDLSLKRYLYDRVDWGERLFAIIGARGVGKTTLMLQHYKENYGSPEDCLYISADNVRVASIGLFEIASNFFKSDGKFLIIDEIHKYPDWPRELKNIYDSFPKARVAITGSSSLGIIAGKHDLSRRMMVHQMKGLSFREYLSIETQVSARPYHLDEILTDHVKIASSIKEKTRVLKHFKDYLKWGYYPFYIEGRGQYGVKLNNVVEKVISEDIPALFGVKTSSIPQLRKLIYLVATSQPFIPNIERIGSQMGISKEYVYNYLEYLDKAGIFSSIYAAEKGLKIIRKPQNIYLENPNLFHAITGEMGFRSEIGAVRESFFLNQLKAVGPVFSAGSGDFIVGNGLLFEIGGEGKSRRQIADQKNAFVVADAIEIGSKGKIPLWLMGFLY